MKNNIKNSWCKNPECKDYLIIDNENIVIKEYKGKNARALLKCKTCGKCFSDGIKWMKEQILKQNVPELRNADGTYGQWGTSGINNQNK